MKKVNRFFAVIITVVLTVGLVSYAGYFLDPIYSQGGIDVVDAFHSLENDSLDVIVYGSSHAWKGFDTRVLNEKYNISAYNYGGNWQAINTSLLFLQDSLTTQTPKVVCIEVGLVDYIEQDQHLDGQMYYSREIPFSMGKLEYFKTAFGVRVDGQHLERYISYFFPIIMFHENWNTITEENYNFGNFQRLINTSGFVPSDDAYECTVSNWKTFEQYELSENTKNILDKMVSACKEKDVEIIFYTAPYEGEYHYNGAMKKYAKENGCTFVDGFEYLSAIGIDELTDFQDSTHLNTSGSRKLATYIGEYIIRKYEN